MPRRLPALLIALALTSGARAADPVAGRWVGTWQSDATGHGGPLRARVTPRADETYRVWFAGRFAGVVPFAHPATFTPGPDGQLTASQNLGPLFGTFTTTASATPTAFDATFQSRRERGRFTLVRP